jgi:hypothetical protein
VRELFLRSSSVLGMRQRSSRSLIGAEECVFLYVLHLNPNPSNLEGFGTPASFSGAWTKHRCRAEGSANHAYACVLLQLARFGQVITNCVNVWFWNAALNRLLRFRRFGTLLRFYFLCHLRSS